MVRVIERSPAIAKEETMPRKTILMTGLLAAVGSGFLVCGTVSAQVPASDGYSNRISGTHTRTNAYRYRHYNRNRSVIGNTSEGFNRIRLPINSTNTLSPVAISSPAVTPVA
jgi:hypothetical protein